VEIIYDTSQPFLIHTSKNQEDSINSGNLD